MRLNHEAEALLPYALTGWCAAPGTLGGRLSALRHLVFYDVKMRAWEGGLPDKAADTPPRRRRPPATLTLLSTAWLDLLGGAAESEGLSDPRLAALLLCSRELLERATKLLRQHAIPGVPPALPPGSVCSFLPLLCSGLALLALGIVNLTDGRAASSEDWRAAARGGEWLLEQTRSHVGERNLGPSVRHIGLRARSRMGPCAQPK